jgi:CBS domain-containing protein
LIGAAEEWSGHSPLPKSRVFVMDTADKVMQREVIAVLSHATVEQTIALLRKFDISGAPVVDKDGLLVGIISEFALLAVLYDMSLRTAPVTRFMTREVLTVTEKTVLSDVATVFVTHRVRRVPVVRDGRLVGLVSRPDLLNYVFQSGLALGHAAVVPGPTNPVTCAGIWQARWVRRIAWSSALATPASDPSISALQAGCRGWLAQQCRKHGGTSQPSHPRRNCQPRAQSSGISPRGKARYAEESRRLREIKALPAEEGRGAARIRTGEWWICNPLP